MGRIRKSNRPRLVLLAWILVGLLYFHFSYDYIRVSMNDRSLTEYLQYVVQIAGAENRPAKEIRQLIMIKASQLDLPVRGDQITVFGSGQMLNVSIVYDVGIQIPMLTRTVYRKLYHHTAEFKRRT